MLFKPLRVVRLGLEEVQAEISIRIVVLIWVEVAICFLGVLLFVLQTYYVHILGEFRLSVILSIWYTMVEVAKILVYVVGMALWEVSVVGLETWLIKTHRENTGRWTMAQLFVLRLA